MLTFAEVWETASQIEGYFRKSNAKCLMDFALRCGPGAEFVEVGSYCGRSTSVLGLVAKENGCRLTCIDAFAQSGNVSPELAATSIVPTLWGLGIRFTLMVMTSVEAAQIFDRPIDLVHIDAGHSYKMAKLDCGLWLPKVKPGKWALFHDYSPGFPGVRQAVDEIEGFHWHTRDSALVVLRKQGPS